MTLALLLITLVAAGIDARTGRIPNWLTLPTLVLGLAGHGLLGGFSALAAGLLGALLCGLIPWMMFRGTNGQGLGGGDVKLFAAIGAVAGPLAGLEIEIVSFLTLALFALIQLAYRGQMWGVLMNVATLLLNPFLPRARRRAIEPAAMTTMRMGPAIFVSAMIVLARPLLTPFVPWLS